MTTPAPVKVTSGLSSVTHPTGVTALGAILAGAGFIAAHPPHTWWEWTLAVMGGISAAYGVLAPKVTP